MMINMTKQKLFHMLTLKSTWVVILSQIVLILNTSGVFDDIQMDKFKIISSSVLVIVETLGLISVYDTQPIADKES